MKRKMLFYLYITKYTTFTTNDILILLTYVYFLDLLDKPNRQLTTHKLFSLSKFK